ncbi:MAG TPA: ACP S-malonyltransferase [Thermoanaerobaculia bacterium]|nr:ACP S-malonyltransferase [Thermoanaerobaculia bacterium]
MIRTAFVFPGQGSQKAGMGRAWAEASPEARRTFEEADDAVGFHLSRLCWEGPEDELLPTANQQPAILATSVAILRGLAAARPELAPVAVAGHSLGEYSALVAAGALELADAVRLVRRRGELMQQAVPPGVGAMAAILGMDAEEVTAVVADAAAPGETCAVANRNAPGQTVIAGHTAAVERAVALATERGARKARTLPVSAPFHSPLMAPARDGMRPELAAVAFADPAVPVVVNVDAAPVADGSALREALVRQIDSPVRWVESVERLTGALGVALLVEVGPGNVLSGLNRRIAPAAKSLSVAEPAGLDKLDEALAALAAAGHQDAGTGNEEEGS